MVVGRRGGVEGGCAETFVDFSFISSQIGKSWKVEERLGTGRGRILEGRGSERAMWLVGTARWVFDWGTGIAFETAGGDGDADRCCCCLRRASLPVGLDKVGEGGGEALLSSEKGSKRFAD